MTDAASPAAAGSNQTRWRVALTAAMVAGLAGVSCAVHDHITGRKR